MLPSITMDIDCNIVIVYPHVWPEVGVCVYSGIHGRPGDIGKIQEYII